MSPAGRLPWSLLLAWDCFEQLGIVATRGHRNSKTPGLLAFFQNQLSKSFPKSKVQPHPAQEIRQSLPGSKSTSAGVLEHSTTYTAY